MLIDRPERRNAFDFATTRELCSAIETVQGDGDVRVLVIKGAGDVFSTGRDLKASVGDPYAEDDAWVRIFHLLHRASIPSVAVVRGYAVAGGFTLAMGCDFVLSQTDALFGAYEMRHGFPAAVCTPILSRLAGPKLGLEFAIFGQPVPAQRLYNVGLINRLAADAEKLEEIEMEFVGHIVGLDPRAVKFTRDIFRAGENMPLDNAFDMGRQLNQLIGAVGGFAKAGRSLRKS